MDTVRKIRPSWYVNWNCCRLCTQIYQDLTDKEREKVENNLLSHIVRQMEGAPDEQLGMMDKAQNFAVASYKSVFKNIASKTYLRGLIDFLKSFDGEAVQGRGAWWVNNKLASYWPNILTKASNDPYMRDAEGFIDTAKKKIASRVLPKRYNMLGEPIKYDENAVARFINNAINPFTVREIKDDPLAQSLVDDEIGIPKLEKVKNGIDLTQFKNKEGKTAFEVYNEKLASSGLRTRLEELIKQDDYKNAPSEITIDENIGGLGGKKIMMYNEVKFYRDLAFQEIEYSDEFKSIQNPDISLGEAYLQKDLIKGISGATNQYPEGLDRGIYDFINQTK